MTPSPTPAPTQLEVRIQTICLLTLTAIGVGVALRWLAPIMIPFVLAVFLAFGLLPIIDLLERYLRIPRALGVLLTFLLGIVVLNLLAALVTSSVAQLTANASVYQQNFSNLLARVSQVEILERLGIDVELAADPLRLIPTRTVGVWAAYVTSSLLGLISKGLVVLVCLFFLLSGATVGGHPNEASVWFEIRTKIERYVLAKSLISAATGALVATVLAVLGVDLAMVFGLFAFLLNFIPSIGSVIATLLPLPVVLAGDLSTTSAVLAIAIPAAIQLVIGNFIDPKVVGESLDLHPVVIILSLIFWGMIWGLVGMLLGVPIVAIVRLMAEKLEVTAPVARLLAGRLG